MSTLEFFFYNIFPIHIPFRTLPRLNRILLSQKEPDRVSFINFLSRRFLAARKRFDCETLIRAVPVLVAFPLWKHHENSRLIRLFT